MRVESRSAIRKGISLSSRDALDCGCYLSTLFGLVIPLGVFVPPWATVSCAVPVHFDVDLVSMI
jgi:hypothetical protein